LRAVAAVYQDDLFHFRWDPELFQYSSRRRPFRDVQSAVCRETGQILFH